jgi:hypothetical protein
MTVALGTTPAHLVRKLLVDLGLCAEPPAGPWPAYVLSEPDSPSAVVTVYNTAGTLSARQQHDGSMEEFFGVQVRLRVDPDKTRVGVAKLQAIAVALSGVSNVPVTAEGYTCTVENLRRTSSVLSLGDESGSSRRKVFTANFLATLED